jgi:transcriptional regulator with XRE-family HTH domain
MQTFGDLIRIAREERNLFLRQVAASLEIDQAIISKFERGERKPTREQVEKFADFYSLDKNELMTSWLSDKVVYSILEEENAEEILKVAEEKVKYLRNKNNGK